MLMMHAPRGTGDHQVRGWSPADFEAHLTFMHQVRQELTAAGSGLMPNDSRHRGTRCWYALQRRERRLPTARSLRRRNSWQATGSLMSKIRRARHECAAG